MNEHCKPKNMLFKHDGVKLFNRLFNRTLGESQQFPALKNSDLNKNFPILFHIANQAFIQDCFLGFLLLQTRTNEVNLGEKKLTQSRKKS